MNPRLRRAVASLAILVFLVFYIWAAVSLSAFVPDVWWAQVLYFAITGTAWGLPLFPLISWAEGRKPKG